MKLKPEIGEDSDGLEITRYCLPGCIEGELDLDEDEISIIQLERDKLQFWSEIFGGTPPGFTRGLCGRAEKHFSSSAKK